MKDDLTSRALAAIEACSSSSDEDDVIAVCNPAIIAANNVGGQSASHSAFAPPNAKLAASNWNFEEGSTAAVGKHVKPQLPAGSKYFSSTRAKHAISVTNPNGQNANGLTKVSTPRAKTSNASNENQLGQNPIKSGVSQSQAPAQPMQRWHQFARDATADLAGEQSAKNWTKCQQKQSIVGQLQFIGPPSVHNQTPFQQKPAASRKRQRIAGSSVLSVEKPSKTKQTARIPSTKKRGRPRKKLKSFGEIERDENAKLSKDIPNRFGQSGKITATHKPQTKHPHKTSPNNFQRSISQSLLEMQLEFEEDIIIPHDLSSKHHDVMKLYTSIPFDCRTMKCLHRFKEFDRPLPKIRYENDLRTISQKEFIRRERNRRIDCMEHELLDDVETCIGKSAHSQTFT